METEEKSKPERKKRRRIWIIIAIVVGLASLSAPIVLRELGFQRIRDIEAEIAAAGDQVSLEQYLDAVEIHEPLQEEFWRWSVRYDALDSFEVESDEDLLEWLSSPPGTPKPAWMENCLAEHAELAEEGRKLLRRDGLVLSAQGWAPIDVSAGATVQDLSRMRMPPFMAIRSLVNYLGAGALISESADPWLRNLDSLIAACDPPGSLIDGLVLVTCSALRDDVYLRCCIRGNASEEQLEGWLSQEPRALLRRANALRGERLLYLRLQPDQGLLDIFSYCRITSPLTPRNFWQEVVAVLEIPWLWVGVPHDTALGIEAFYLIERRLSGDLTVDLDVIDELSRQAWTSMYHSGMISRKRIVASAVEADANHRIVRLAARLLLDSRKGIALPGSVDEFRERYPAQLDGSENLFALEYATSGPDRFRLAAHLGPYPRSSLLRLAASELSVGPLPAGKRKIAYETTDLAIDVWIPAWFHESGETKERPGRK